MMIHHLVFPNWILYLISLKIIAVVFTSLSFRREIVPQLLTERDGCMTLT